MITALVIAKRFFLPTPHPTLSPQEERGKVRGLSVIQITGKNRNNLKAFPGMFSYSLL
jgi:hypothetical protein